MRYTQKDYDSWPDGHKGWSLCRRVLPYEKVGKHKGELLGLNRWCKECRKPKAAAAYDKWMKK